jgi:hypothetical protein
LGKDPNPKLQVPKENIKSSNLQNPQSAATLWMFEVWELQFPGMLAFGIWNLEMAL